MHIADITMFYAPASGDVHTYLDASLLGEGRAPMTRARWLALHNQPVGRAA